MPNDIAKLPIPKGLRMAIAKIMVDEKIDWGDTCQRMIQIVDINSAEFKKFVDHQANKRYDSRHMKRAQQGQGVDREDCL